MYTALACVLVVFFYLGTIECRPEDMDSTLKEIHAACQTETGVPEAVIDEADKGIFSEDVALKCYLKCVWVKAGLMDDTGKVDIEATFAMIPDEQKPLRDSTVRKCSVIVAADACDAALLINKCYFENTPQYFYVP